ncbi:MerR family transcriptional regulator [Nocardioides cynanchi]|uniref:MerR family transcriptional regulator n=1 Tax=Nocardioides cynanchi TaxID=2558918 RepID=UPI0012489ED1|nr:MerR family transcriptional regulator [Nocardioides cynanchi]
MERMTIGDFAREAGLTPKALRLYDEMGLIVPADVDAVSGYRYYGDDQLERARLVSRLRLVGMPLARIHRVADLPRESAAAEVASYWRQVEADTRTRRARVHAFVAEMRAKETHMSGISTQRCEVASRLEQGHRTEQRDATHAGERLWVVADGMGTGGHAAAVALAAFLATELEGEPLGALDAAVARAQRAVESLHGGLVTSTTLTAAWLLDDRLAVAHIGDSRACVLRDGELIRLTSDHTEVQSLIDEGSLTEEEARSDPRRNLLNRALAEEGPGEADVFVVPVRDGDRIVLTTDGVHAVLEPERLHALLGSGTPQESVDAVAAAVEEAGAPDNYSVVVADLA